MNLALYGLGDPRRRQWLAVDLGVAFAGDDLPGIDIIMPDIRFLIEERRNLAGIVLTHAHEDHYGALIDLVAETASADLCDTFHRGVAGSQAHERAGRA